MVGRHHPDPFSFRPDAPLPRDPDFRIQQVFRRRRTQKYNHLRFHQPGLHPQMNPAGFRLFRRRHPVVRRAAFHHIADINPLPGKPDGRQHPGQQLTGRADEGQSLLVLHLPGAFPDQHQRGIAVSLSGNFVPDLPPKRAKTARCHLLFKQFPGNRLHMAVSPFLTAGFFTVSPAVSALPAHIRGDAGHCDPSQFIPSFYFSVSQSQKSISYDPGRVNE